MVGSINAPSTGATSFSAFQAAAMQIGSSETAVGRILYRVNLGG